jgi:hypothetical protein
MVELATSTGQPRPWIHLRMGYQLHAPSREHFYLPGSFSLRFEGPIIFASFLDFKSRLEHFSFKVYLLEKEVGGRCKKIRLSIWVIIRRFEKMDVPIDPGTMCK